MPNSTKFKGQIKVASRIIDYLSSGLYETPAACLKELINNSFDADAIRVSVFVKPDADRIIIEDDGNGINRDEFVRHFDRVSESHKRDDADKTASGRFKIGRIGIGFIAANEICDVMEIFSTKPGENTLLHVKIDFGLMRKDPQDRKQQEDYAKADYEGEILHAPKNEHYTKLFLTGVRDTAKPILAGAVERKTKSETLSLYGKKPSSVYEILALPELRSWSDFDFYSETMLRVGLNVPVQYHDEWMPEPLYKKVEPFVTEVRKLNFQVFYDGSELRKPIVFNPGERRCFLRTFEFSGKEVSARGYFFVRHGALRPQELNGVLIRIRQAAVGNHDPTFLGYPSSENTLFQKWVSGEVWADDRLEDALNIDRKTLRISHPAYVELQQSLHSFLSGLFKQTRDKLYVAGSLERKKEKAEDTVRSLEEFARLEVAPIDQQTALRIQAAWKPKADREGGKRTERQMLRKFTVIELYRIVLEVATEVLSKQQVKKFIDKLTQRLLK
jgi:hypothetical protein